jgi:hypothetical protein
MSDAHLVHGAAVHHEGTKATKDSVVARSSSHSLLEEFIALGFLGVGHPKSPRRNLLRRGMRGTWQAWESFVSFVPAW